MPMNDAQLLRYSRHILLNELGIEGQSRFLESHVLIVGAGGLGSPAALYLAAAGVGTLTLVDGDRVDASNLQRQILHTEAQVGQWKTDSGLAALTARNPEIRIITRHERLEGKALEMCVANADLVLDCSDNFDTRYAINHACFQQKKPLVSGAAVRFGGQISVFDFSNPQSPCYHCLFPNGQEAEEMRCAVTGVFAPLTGIIGSLQAAEALKLLAGIGEPLVGRLMVVDTLTQTFRTLKFGKDPTCPVCAAQSNPNTL